MSRKLLGMLELIVEWFFSDDHACQRMTCHFNCHFNAMFCSSWASSGSWIVTIEVTSNLLACSKKNHSSIIIHMHASNTDRLLFPTSLLRNNPTQQTLEKCHNGQFNMHKQISDINFPSLQNLHTCGVLYMATHHMQYRISCNFRLRKVLRRSVILEVDCLASWTWR